MSLSAEPVLYVMKLDERATDLRRGTLESAGYDLFPLEECILPPKRQLMIDTGLSIKIPKSHYGRIAPRSSLALKHGIAVQGGVIDADFSGPIKVILFNHSSEPLHLSPHRAMAQLILEKCSMIRVELVPSINHLFVGSQRGENGFGHTDGKPVHFRVNASA